MALFGDAYWASIEVREFNVDEFIESVYQEFAGTVHEESREALRKVWTATLSMPIQGDASIYPNNNGKHRAAAMKVWHKAGDFWRAKYRLGDKLLCDQHGIALTRNDLASIAKAKAGATTNEPALATTPADGTEAPVEGAAPAVPSGSPDGQEGTKEEAPAAPKAEPQQLDLFMMSHQTSAQRPPRRRRQASAIALQPSDIEPSPSKNVMRMVAIGAAMVFVGVLLMETGLIIPVGIGGLLIGGILK